LEKHAPEGKAKHKPGKQNVRAVTYQRNGKTVKDLEQNSLKNAYGNYFFQLQKREEGRNKRKCPPLKIT